MEKPSSEIQKNYTGNNSQDLEHLSRRILETETNNELFQDLFELVIDLLQQSQTGPLFDAYFKKKLEQIQSVYEKACHLKDIGFYEEALNEINEIVQNIMPMNELFQSMKYDIRNFSKPFEHDLYEMLEPSKKVYNTPIPYSGLLCLHGNLLIALGRIEEAITSLALALNWNPVSHDASILLAEAYKFTNDIDMLYELTISRFSSAYSKIHLAELYYNLGYYYGTENRPEDSVACFTLCSRYGGQEIAASAIYQLEKRYKKSFQWASEAQLEKSAESCGYPLVPDSRIIQLARMNAMRSYLDGDNDQAVYYTQIALDLSDSSEDASFLNLLTASSFIM